MSGAAVAVFVAVLMIAPTTVGVTPDTSWQAVKTTTHPTGDPLKPVWDSRDGELVVLTATATSLGWTIQTWTFASGKWTHLASATPQLFPESPMTYDRADGYVLLFGPCQKSGTACSKPMSETWAFYGNSWHHLFPKHSPAPRLGAAMSYDAALQRVVLFGGLNLTGNSSGFYFSEFSDTWTYVGGVWTRLAPSHHPSMRDSVALAGDPATGWPILFGGQLGTNSPDLTLYYNDTWAFEGSAVSSANWVRISVNAHHPQPQVPAGLTYDFNNREMILETDCGATACYYNTWAFVLTGRASGTWSLLNAPLPSAARRPGGLTFDSALDHPAQAASNFTSSGVQYVVLLEFT
jgi:hypothetical protein